MSRRRNIGTSYPYYVGVGPEVFGRDSQCADEYAKLWAWFAETKVQSHSNGPAMEPARVKWEMSVKAGKIKPVVGKVYPMEEAAAVVHQRVENDQRLGTVVLTIGGAQ